MPNHYQRFAASMSKGKKRKMTNSTTPSTSRVSSEKKIHKNNKVKVVKYSRGRITKTMKKPIKSHYKKAS